MNINTILNSVNEISQNIVRFVFTSKWTIPIIILLIILYLIWIGLGDKEKIK